MNILPFTPRPQRGPLAASSHLLATRAPTHAGRCFAAALEALRTEHELTVVETANLAEIIARLSGVRS